MKIYLLRHGKTYANEKNLYCGQTDLPLSESGIAEIAALKLQGIYPPADMFFASGLRRSSQTIDIIYGNVSRRAISEMSEYAFGNFEMKSYEELKILDEYKRWFADDTGNVKCPGGESKGQFKKRVTEGYVHILNESLRAGAGSVAIVCHGGVIAQIMDYLFPGTQNFYDWHPQNGRGYALTYISKKPSAYEKI